MALRTLLAESLGNGQDEKQSVEGKGQRGEVEDDGQVEERKGAVSKEASFEAAATKRGPSAPLNAHTQRSLRSPVRVSLPTRHAPHSHFSFFLRTRNCHASARLALSRDRDWLLGRHSPGMNHFH